MSEILQDLSVNRLIIANEENLFSWIPVLGKMGEIKINDPPGVIRSITDVRVAIFNSIMNTQLTAGNVEATIRRIVDDAQSRDVPILWWIGPSTRPKDLRTRLEKSGFTIVDDGPGMAIALEELKESLAGPEGLSIQPAQDEDSWREWSRTIALGFEVPREMVDLVANAWYSLIRQADPEITQAYIARQDGKALATSLSQMGGGVVGIYAVSTLPKARRKGIGAQVTLFPLLEARTRGYKAGILQSSEMGLGVYRSLGFREYCRIRSYQWRPK